MTIKLSSKGQLVIPKALRKMAEIEEGDELDVGFSGGMIVLRKPEPLDAGRVRRLLVLGSFQGIPILSPNEFLKDQSGCL